MESHTADAAAHAVQEEASKGRASDCPMNIMNVTTAVMASNAGMIASLSP